MFHNPNRSEAERLLAMADKLLQNRDLSGSRDFAVLAQEAEPLLDGSDQILAVLDVLLADDRRVNNHQDWYAILQLDRRSDDLDLIKKSYRRLALLLHPDKNKFYFADHAFRLVADAWAVLSDPARKAVLDTELSLYSRLDLPTPAAAASTPARRGGTNIHSENARNGSVLEPQRNQPRAAATAARSSSFWTACPYCYILYEYPAAYEKCCLRCESCKRGFEAVVVPKLPPLVQGRDEYYCCWGFFPMGYVGGSAANKGKVKPPAAAAKSFSNWMPPIFTPPPPQQTTPVTMGVPVSAARGDGVLNFSGGNSNHSNVGTGSAPRKRGRPRKIV